MSELGQMLRWIHNVRVARDANTTRDRFPSTHVYKGLMPTEASPSEPLTVIHVRSLSYSSDD
jgi:hypothetical protein